MQKVIVILGPTAVGKTALGKALAKSLNGEIISADATQIYRGLNIGSAKISPQEQEGITHHLIDIKNFNESFNAFMFVDMAKKVIDEIIERGKTPIIVGGTNLYVTALIKNYQFEKSNKQETPYQSKHQLGFEVFALNYQDRQMLYNKINARVDLMLKQGLVNEVTRLKKEGLSSEMQAGKGIGYKEILAYLDNQCTYEFAVDKIKQHSRNFAKRQLTWLRSLPFVVWLDAELSIEENKKIILNKKTLN